LPPSFSETYCREVRGSGAECARLDKFTRLAPDIYSTGPLGKAVAEQALILYTPQGLIVLTGCAHPGIVKIVRSARAALGKPVQLVLGGFHLAAKSGREIEGIIAEFKKLGVVQAAPSHCTGKKAIARFRAAYRKKIIPAGAGRVIIL